MLMDLKLNMFHDESGGSPYGDGAIEMNPGASDTMRIPVGVGLFDASDENHELTSLDESKKRLAKRANQIYRSLCEQFQLNECFFYGFRYWSEFVDGKISEASFYENARAEARNIFAKTGS